MKKGLFRKGIVLGIIVFFVGACVIPSTVGIKKEKTTNTPIKSGSYIQDLIDNASDGDTINIPSGIYYENITINKSISLIGEDKDTTIIDGGGNGTVIYLHAKKATVSGFTLQNGDPGIHIFFSGRNVIKGNNFNGNGILISGSDFNIISGNNINHFNGTGIKIFARGIGLPGMYVPSSFNFIKGNNISNNKRGIYLYYSDFSFIIKNNFIDNEEDAYFYESFLNCWKQNYWNKSRILPKIIFGEIDIDRFGDGAKWIDWVNIDWRPAKEPYDI